jgi:hypothetical protein
MEWAATLLGLGVLISRAVADFNIPLEGKRVQGTLAFPFPLKVHLEYHGLRLQSGPLADTYVQSKVHSSEESEKIYRCQ